MAGLRQQANNAKGCRRLSLLDLWERMASTPVSEVSKNRIKQGQDPSNYEQVFELEEGLFSFGRQREEDELTEEMS